MLRLLKTKGCKRCGGNLSLEKDEYGAYVACIQCGAVWNDVEAVPQPDREERQPVGAAKTGSRR